MTQDDQDKAAAPAVRDPQSSSFRTLLYGACVTVLVVLVLAGYDGSRDLARLKARKTQLEKRLQTTEAAIAELSDRIERLQADPYTLEKAAREELGLSRPGEVVVILPRESGGRQASPSQAPTPPRNAG